MTQRTFSTRELEARHHALDVQIRKLEKRGPLMTTEEQVRAAQLKKIKLATKDQLNAKRSA